jgi:histidyl-tRNA synthetase
MGENAKFKAFELSKELRCEGFDVIIDVCERSLKAQLKYADRLGARYCAVIGENELEKGVAALRDMNNSTQEDVEFKNIKKVIGK